MAVRRPRKRNLWVASELYYPETTSTGYLLTQIAEALAEDFNVKVLCNQPSYSKRGFKAPKSEIKSGVRIRRCWSTTLNKNIMALRILNLTTASLSILSRAVTSFMPGDIVLVVTNPPALPFTIRAACFLKRSRCILLVHDVYPDLLTAVGKLRTNSLATNMLSAASRILFRSMAHILVLGRDMRALIESKLNGRMRGLEMIPNWAEVDTVYPQPKHINKILMFHNLVDKFVALYAGNMGYAQDIEVIIEAADRLRDHQGIHFLFIGSGAKRGWLEQTVKERDLNNITVLGNLPREDQCSFLNSCDVGLISLVKGMKGISVPSRLYNLLASGKPIIAIVDERSEVAMIVEEGQLGWNVQPGRTDELTEAILQAKAKPEALIRMGARARKMAEEDYSFDRIISRYRSVLNNIQ